MSFFFSENFGGLKIKLHKNEDGTHSFTTKSVTDEPINLQVELPKTPRTVKRLPPVSPKLMDVTELGWTIDGSQEIEPYYLGNYGDTVRIIGYYNSGLYQSLDNGETWEQILVGGLLSGRPRYVFTVPNPDFDKSVLFVTSSGSVYRSTDLSDPSIANWEKVLDPPSSGNFTERYGRSIHGNMVILSTYHQGYDPTGENPARFLYISQDYGETFREVELPSIMVKDPTQFHIHDVEYDPYTKRMWLSIGDQSNSGLYYSDDFANSWELVEGAPIKPTNITALPNVVLFGTDDRPSAIYGYKKNDNGEKKDVKWDDIEMLITPLTSSSDVLLIANLNHMDIDANLGKQSGFVMPFERDQNGQYSATILCSPDGLHWTELFRLDELDPTFKTATLGRVIGYATNDPKRACYIFFYHSSIGNKMVRIEVPEWVEMPL